MRIALVSDIHGNTVALNAVLDEIALSRIDVIVCLGDLAANGPDPAGAVDRIAELGCQVAMGNTDTDMVDVPDWWRDPAAAGAPESAHPIAEIGLWCAAQLTDEHRRFLAGLPGIVGVDLGEAGRFLGFHGSPRSATDIITNTTPPDDELGEMLNGADQAVLAGGHTHVPMVRRHHTQTIINPGSVGLPFAAYGYAGQVPVLDHAAYALLTIDGPAMSIELRQVRVDKDTLSRHVEASGMPHGAWWLGLRH